MRETLSESLKTRGERIISRWCWWWVWSRQLVLLVIVGTEWRYKPFFILRHQLRARIGSSSNIIEISFLVKGTSLNLEVYLSLRDTAEIALFLDPPSRNKSADLLRLLLNPLAMSAANEDTSASSTPQFVSPRITLPQIILSSSHKSLNPHPDSDHSSQPW